MLTSARASIWWRRMGLLPNSTSGLGRERVSGLNRVPKPPTRIKAFIWLARTKLKRRETCSGTKVDHARSRWCISPAYQSCLCFRLAHSYFKDRGHAAAFVWNCKPSNVRRINTKYLHAKVWANPAEDSRDLEDEFFCCSLRMDPMGAARQAMSSSQTVIVRPPGAPSLLPAALPSGGAQLAAAFFPPPTAFAGMPPPFLGTPSGRCCRSCVYISHVFSFCNVCFDGDKCNGCR